MPNFYVNSCRDSFPSLPLPATPQTHAHSPPALILLILTVVNQRSNISMGTVYAVGVFVHAICFRNQVHTCVFLHDAAVAAEIGHWCLAFPAIDVQHARQLPNNRSAYAAHTPYYVLTYCSLVPGWSYRLRI